MSTFVAAIICAVLYGAAVAILLFKNSHRRDARLVAVGAILVWPALFFLSYLQLAFVIPTYTVFFLHGLILPKLLPPRTIGIAIGLTVLFLGAVGCFAMLADSPS